MKSYDGYVIVESGDTLWDIAQAKLGDAKKYTLLASWNNIKTPQLIYPGQKIWIKNPNSSGSTGSSSSSSTSANNSNAPIINHFGLQADTDNTVFATWTWSKDHTDCYEYRWYYRTKDNIDFVASTGTTKEKQSTYSYPNNATHVKFKVKAKSTTHTVNKKETNWWTGDWSAVKTYTVKDTPPTKPSTPDVKIEEFTLTATLDNINEDTKQIELQIVKDDSSIFKTAKVDVNYAHISYSCSINVGGKYKVRARAINGSNYSDWSDYSSNIETIPSTPVKIKTIRAHSKTEIYLEWDKINNATSYDIEYTTDKQYFDVSSNTQTVTGIEGTSHILTGLESGNQYFVRIRAVNEQGESGWSEISSTIIGSKPIAPTTWSSSTVVMVGEDLYLYWVHNTEDGSSERYAVVDINGQEIIVKNDKINDEDHKDDTKFYKVNTSAYKEGTEIKWRVKTCGITDDCSDYSITRTVNIYARPSLELHLQNNDGSDITTVEEFPFYIKGLPGPNTQNPIGFSVIVKSNDTYETTDRIGNPIVISKGDEIFSRYYDAVAKDADDKSPFTFMLQLTPDLIDLENNIPYILSVTVSMDSGLTATSDIEFEVSWTDIKYTPSAEITIDKEPCSAYIRPYCTYRSTVFKIVTTSGIGSEDDNYNDIYGIRYHITDEIFDGDFSVLVEDGYYIDDDGMPQYFIYQGITKDGKIVEYCETIGDEKYVEDITLSVYRREFDGTFTEIGSGLDNTEYTFITDPHPALDYARYRIVAVDNKTGAISYTDTPAYPVNETAIIIQWDEKWSNFDTDGEGDELTEQPWTGSLLRLPYNIDVSDSHDLDVEFTNYVGRKHPVSYYGTHVGEKSSWGTEIPMDDKETIYALRRLAIWMGDVYVREPSGTGYWAHLSVSFSQTHCEVTIPVSLDITRVEGGI